MNAQTLEDIINSAIESEVAAYQFYSAAAQKMTDPSAQALFSELAEEEKQHEETLANLDLSNMQSIPTYDLPDLGIAEEIEKPVLSIEMAFVDAIALAMKNEEEAMILYDLLSKCTDNPEQQHLFQSLSAMEKGHKARLEDIYKNAAYAQIW